MARGVGVCVCVCEAGAHRGSGLERGALWRRGLFLSLFLRKPLKACSALSLFPFTKMGRQLFRGCGARVTRGCTARIAVCCWQTCLYFKRRGEFEDVGRD